MVVLGIVGVRCGLVRGASPPADPLSPTMVGRGASVCSCMVMLPLHCAAGLLLGVPTNMGH